MHHLHLVHTNINDNKLLWAVLEYLHPQQEAEGFVLKQRKIWKSGGAKINNVELVWFDDSAKKQNSILSLLNC